MLHNTVGGGVGFGEKVLHNSAALFSSLSSAILSTCPAHCNLLLTSLSVTFNKCCFVLFPPRDLSPVCLTNILLPNVMRFVGELVTYTGRTVYSVMGDSMERYPERCFHIIAPGQPQFDFNTSSISPLYETSYKTLIFYYKQIKIMSMPQ